MEDDKAHSLIHWCPVVAIVTFSVFHFSLAVVGAVLGRFPAEVAPADLPGNFLM